MIWPTCLLGWAAAHSRASAECWSQCRLALRPEAKCPVNVDEMRAPDLPPNSVPPFADRSVARQQEAAALLAARDELKKRCDDQLSSLGSPTEGRCAGTIWDWQPAPAPAQDRRVA